MKEWICREMSTSTSDNENGVLMMEIELIRCKDCKLWMKNPYRESSVFGLCFKHKDIAIATDETDWCSWAERKEDGKRT